VANTCHPRFLFNKPTTGRVFLGIFRIFKRISVGKRHFSFIDNPIHMRSGSTVRRLTQVGGMLIMFLVGCGEPHSPAKLPSPTATPLRFQDLLSREGSATWWHWLVDADRGTIEGLLKEAETWQYAQVERALTCAHRAYQLSAQHQEEHLMGQSLYWLALLKKQQAFDGEGVLTALADANLSLQLFEGLGDLAWKVRVLNLMGMLHLRQGKFKLAQTYQSNALIAIQQAEPPLPDSLSLLGEVHLDLGNTYFELAEYDQAGEQYRISQVYFRRLAAAPALGRLQRNLGNLAMARDSFDQALIHYQAGLELGLTEGDVELEVISLEGLALLAIRRFGRTADPAYAEQAISHLRAMDGLLTESRFRASYQLGRIYHFMAGINQDAAAQDSAVGYYELAMAQAAGEGQVAIMRKAVYNLGLLCSDESSPCHARMAQFFPTFQQDQYQAVMDTMLAVQRQADQRLRWFEVDQIAATSARQLRTTLAWASLIIIALGLTGVIVVQRLQQQKLKHKLKALRAQINPHFVANTITAIESLVNQNQRAAASDHLIEFTRLNRQLIEASRKEMVPLSQEIYLLHSYLKLIKLRMEDKITYDISVAPSLREEVAWVPGMLIQPFVENAIFHGINPKDGPGRVEIRFWREGKHLLIAIDDDGIGLTAAAARRQASHRKSYGIKITQERLQAINGVRNSKPEVKEKRDEQGRVTGTLVLIRLPYRERSDLKIKGES
jgi:two-component sensor histidine kinase